MKFLIVFAIASVLLAGSTLAIHNGLLAAIGQFPYQVRLAMDDVKGKSSSCGGAIIDKNWILTAAHCLCPYDNITRASIYYGTTERVPDDVQPLLAYTEDFICHSKYHRMFRCNDIALARVPTITFNSLVQPIRLPSRVYDVTGKELVVSGWGRRNSTTDETTSELEYLVMKGSPLAECIACHNKQFTKVRDTNICAVDENKGAPCLGDSGGPLVDIELKTLVGLVSIGTSNTCESGNPEVFTQVASYLTWIKENTGIDFTK